MKRIALLSWNKLKTQPDIWLFFLFLLTFSLSVRKVLFYFPIEGAFNEYTASCIHLSDIFLILTISLWFLLILSHTNNILSMIKLWITWAIHDLYTLLPIVLVLFSFISIFWSANQSIAFFRSLKLAEFILLYFYIRFRIVPCLPRVPEMFHVEHFWILRDGTTKLFTGWNIIFNIIIFNGLFQSIVAIIQFITQKSLGLRFLQESIINPQIPGVAKIIVDQEKYIRAYGFMPHPNILGGFLLFTIIISLLYLKMFHVEHCKEIADTQILTKMRGLEKKWLIKAIIFIQGIALLLTFSKSAILGLIIALLYIKFKNVPHGTFLKYKLNLKYSRVNILLGSIAAILVFIIIQHLNLYYFIMQPLKERLLLLNVSRGTLIINPLLGLGAGQFVWHLQNLPHNLLQIWQYQPIHNVFLLIYAELGLIGLGLFAGFLWILFQKDNLYKRQEDNLPILNNKYYIMSSNIVLTYFKAILLSFIFIMLFDHYFWDIQQGSLIFWLVSGFIVGLTNNLYNT